MEQRELKDFTHYKRAPLLEYGFECQLEPFQKGAKPPHVNGRSTLRSKWLADGENSGPFHFPAFYPAPDQSGVVHDRRDVKDGRKSPACQHLFKLPSDLLRREFFRVKQTRRKDVHVAVPEAAVTTKPLQSITVASGGTLTAALGPKARMRPSCTRIEPFSIACSGGEG
jgi:hypothetical protein